MLHQRQQCHWRQLLRHRLDEQTQEDAGRGAVERQARGIVDLDVPAPSSAATRRASSRSGVTSAAVAPGVSSFSRRIKAMTSASSCGPAQSSRRSPAQTSGPKGSKRTPAVAGGGRPQRLERHHAPRSRSAGHDPGRGPIFDFGGIAVETGEKPCHQMLGVRGIVGDLGPGRGIAIAREARQHDRAVGQRRHRRDEIGDRRQAGGDAGSDHRLGRLVLAPGIGLGREHAVAPRRRIEAADLGQRRRPMLGDDGEKFEHVLPVLGMFGRHQRREAGEIAAPRPAPRRESARVRRRAARLGRRYGGRFLASAPTPAPAASASAAV